MVLIFFLAFLSARDILKPLLEGPPKLVEVVQLCCIVVVEFHHSFFHFLLQHQTQDLHLGSFCWQVSWLHTPACKFTSGSGKPTPWRGDHANSGDWAGAGVCGDGVRGASAAAMGTVACLQCHLGRRWCQPLLGTLSSESLKSVPQEVNGLLEDDIVLVQFTSHHSTFFFTFGALGQLPWWLVRL